MPGDNFSRRVARAAAAGGGRTYRAQTPVTWYLVLLLICLLGVSLVTYSRYEREHPPAAVAAKQSPPTSTDEWQAAVALDVCGTFVPTGLPVDVLPTDPLASIGNDVVRIEPGLSPDPTAFEGAKADLGAYLSIEGAEITPLILSFPGKPVPVPTTTTTTTTTLGPTKTTTTTTSSTTTTTTSPTTTSTTKAGTSTSSSSTTSTSTSTTTTTIATKPGPPRVYKDGQDCGSKPGQIELETWSSPGAKKGTVVPVDKADTVRLTNGELITIAFLPKGVAIPRPPAAARQAVLTFLIEDPSGFATTTTTIPIATSSTTSTTAAGGSTTSSTTAKSSTSSSSSSSTTTSSTG